MAGDVVRSTVHAHPVMVSMNQAYTYRVIVRNGSASQLRVAADRGSGCDSGYGARQLSPSSVSMTRGNTAVPGCGTSGPAGSAV